MKYIEEPSRKVPILAETEVLIIGGGPGGISAALAEAREGVSTMLVERYGCFGGVITQAMIGTIAWYRYANTVDAGGIGLEFEAIAKNMNGSINIFGNVKNKDMEKLLHKLKKRYQLVLLSNTDKIHFDYIKAKYKILNIFDDLIVSYKVGYKKPNPFIYLKAIKKSKTLLNSILYIDDIPEFVLVAKFFGIKSIQYKNIQQLKSDLRKLNIKI